MRIDKRLLWISLPIVVTALAGCDSAPGYTPQPMALDEVAKLSSGQEATLMPFTIGATWIYALETTRTINGRDAGGESGTIQFKVAKTVPKSGGTQAVIEVSREGQMTDRQIWLLNSKGLYQVAVGLNSALYTPMQPLVIFPVVENATFAFDGTGPTAVGKIGKMTGSGKILASQGLDTELGRMSGIPVESLSKFTTDNGQGQMENTTWFKPGVGIVRLKQTVLYQTQTPDKRTAQFLLDTTLKLRTYKVTP